MTGNGIDLVTGGCGFIGQHLVRSLQDRGRSVRVIDLSPAHAGFADVDFRQASILDKQAVNQAVQGVDRVFHVAGDPALWSRGGHDFDRVNRTGAETVLNAAVEAGVDRIVLTSTHAIDVRSEGPLLEKLMPGPYTRAKFRAEQHALRLTAAGAPIIAVAPTMPIGPGDHNLTPPMRMLLEFLRRENPAFLEFQTNLIDVREVAEGHVLAAEHGEIGTRYVLGRHNIDMSAFLRLLGRISGVKMPTRSIPYALAWCSAAVFEAGALITRKPPRASLEGVRLARRLAPVPEQPAVSLGLAEWPLEDAVRDAVHWLRLEGYVGHND